MDRTQNDDDLALLRVQDSNDNPINKNHQVWHKKKKKTLQTLNGHYQQQQRAGLKLKSHLVQMQEIKLSGFTTLSFLLPC